MKCNAMQCNACMYACMYVCGHAHTYAPCTYTCIHTHIHIEYYILIHSIFVSMHVLHVNTFVYFSSCIYVLMYACGCMCFPWFTLGEGMRLTEPFFNWSYSGIC